MNYPKPFKTISELLEILKNSLAQNLKSQIAL